MEVFLLVASAAAILIIVLACRTPLAAPQAAPQRSFELALGDFPSDGDYETEVVGESHYQDALETICGGRTEQGHELECEATLKLEPDNAHDANAVGVWIEGRQVGYLARGFAVSVSAAARRHGVSEIFCDALVVGGWSGAKDDGHFGVKLDLQEDDLEDNDD